MIYVRSHNFKLGVGASTLGLSVLRKDLDPTLSGALLRGIIVSTYQNASSYYCTNETKRNI